MSQNISELYPWINLDFVRMLVEKSDPNQNLTVQSFRTGKAVDDGSNFSSNAIRLFVDLLRTDDQTNLTRVYFLKICLRTEDFLKACSECLYYEKEIEIYHQILPEVEALLQSINVPSRFTPRYIRFFLETFRKLKENFFADVSTLT